MSIRIRENLGGLVAATSKSPSIPSTKPQIGKVFGVVLDPNTPSKELFEKEHYVDRKSMQRVVNYMLKYYNKKKI